MSHKHFSNKECEFYPCKNTDLNCLFCFCPIYHHDDCGGEYSFTAEGIKDCSECLLPHQKDGYEYIMDFIKAKSKK